MIATDSSAVASRDVHSSEGLKTARQVKKELLQDVNSVEKFRRCRFKFLVAQDPVRDRR